MIIKVSDNPDRYVNTDNIELITFTKLKIGAPTRCAIDFRSGRRLEVSDSAGRALLEFAESNSAFVENNPDLGDIASEQDAVARLAPSSHIGLRSRLAQHLRDSAPNGNSFTELLQHFELAGNEQLTFALQELITERVVVILDGVYYHASNAPRA